MQRIQHAFFHQTATVKRRMAAGLSPVDEVQRFRLLVCCLFCSICTSLVYAFDLFTTDFSDRFNFSVGDQSTISTVGLVFCYFTVPYGFLYDHMGPYPLIVISAFAGGLGALLLGLVFDGVIVGSVLNISVFYALLNTCSGVIDIAYIVTLAEVFPRNLGPVVALAKVMTSLGSSVFASLSVNIFMGNISGFIYSIMVFCIVVCFVASFIVVLPPYFVNGWRRRGKTQEQIAFLESLRPAYRRKIVPYRRLAVGYAVVAALLLFFTIETPLVSYAEVSSAASTAIGILTILLVLCFFFMLLPVRWLGGMDDEEDGGDVVGLAQAALSDGIPTEAFNTIEGVTATSTQAGGICVITEEPADEGSAFQQDPRYSGSIWDSLKGLDIWLIFVTFVCQSALGIIVVYNASTISVALLGQKRSQQTSALYTAFLGVSSSIGRILMGMFEAFVQQQRPENRRYSVTLALPLSPLLAAVGGILLLTIPAKYILLPYIIIYFEEGVFASVCAIIFPSIYENNHAVYYNIGFLTTVVSVIGFNRFLFGYVVDAKHASLGFGPDEECTVPECVRLPLIVATCTAALAIVSSVIVHIRYRRFIRKEWAKTTPHPHPMEPVAFSTDLKQEG